MAGMMSLLRNGEYPSRFEFVWRWVSSEVVLSTCEVGIGARCAVNCKLSPTLCSLVEFQLSSWLHVVSSVAAEEMCQFC